MKKIQIRGYNAGISMHTYDARFLKGGRGGCFLQRAEMPAITAP